MGVMYIHCHLGFSLVQVFGSRHTLSLIVLDSEFDFKSGASAEQQADDPLM